MKKIKVQISARYNATRADIFDTLAQLENQTRAVAEHLKSGGDRDDGHLLILFSGRLDRLLSRAMELRQLKALIEKENRK